MEDKHITAMKLVAEWRKMRNLCNERTSCRGCGYYQNKACDMLSTEQMIENVADAFDEYLSTLEETTL